MRRRQFLVALGGVAVAVSGACRRSVAAPPPPRQAPSVSSSILGTPKPVSEAEAFLVAVPDRVRDRALALLPEEVHVGIKAGLLCLSERCPYEKFKLDYCESSGWFECPHCGSKFNGLGDKTAGPAPHSMNLFRLDISLDKDVSVVPRPLIKGLPIGTSLGAQWSEGPHCQ